jgi:Fe-S cluster biogenesis protein NfuA
MPDSKREFTRRSGRIEELVSRIETTGDPAIRAIAQELLQAVIELHGAALERILDAVAILPSAETALAQLVSDELVSSVLSLHGMNPVSIEQRVLSALEQTRPYLKSHGGNVELESIEEDGTVYLRLQGSCGSCSSSSETLKSTVESAIYDAAPEVKSVIAESIAAALHSDLVILQTS